MLRPPAYVFPAGTPRLFNVVNWAAIVGTLLVIALGVGLSITNSGKSGPFLDVCLSALLVVWVARTALLIWYGRRGKAFRKN